MQINYIPEQTVIVKTSLKPEEDHYNIQEALNSKRQVILDCGKFAEPFILNKPLEFTMEGQSLSGLNPKATNIEFRILGKEEFGIAMRGQHYQTLQNVHISSNKQFIAPENAVVVKEVYKDSKIANPSFSNIENVFLEDMYNGILYSSGSEHRMKRVHIRRMKGFHGIKIQGAFGGNEIYRVIMDDILSDSTENQFFDHIIQDSYAYSIVIDKAALLWGNIGFTMRDSVGNNDPDNKGAYPTWAIVNDLETDHTRQNGVNLCGGEGFYGSNCWFGSSLLGNGLSANAAWRGETNLSVTRVMGNYKSGVQLAAGKNHQLSNIMAGDNNSNNALQDMAGIAIENGASGVRGSTVLSGDLVGVSGNHQQYGISIGKEVTNCKFDDSCDFSGNIKGEILDKSLFNYNSGNKLPVGFIKRYLSYRRRSYA